MNPSSRTAPRKRGTIYILAELAFFFLLTAATALFLRPLQKDLLGKLETLRDSFIEQAESAIGRRIEYRSMGPSLFKSIDLRGVRISAPDGGEFLSLERLRIEYSLLSLLRGERVNAFRGLSLDRPILRWNLERDADLLDRFLPGSSESQAREALLLPPAARIRVRAASVNVVGKGLSASVEGVSADLNARDGRFVYNARAEVEYVDARLPPAFGRLRTVFSLVGDAAPDFSRVSFALAVPRAETPVLTLRKQSVQVSYGAGVFDIRKTKDSLPFDYRLRWDAAVSAGSVSIAMDRFVPRQAVGASGPWAENGVWLSSKVSGRAEAELSLSGLLSYRFSLQAETPPESPVSRARLRLAGTGDKTGVSVDSSSFESSLGSASFSGSIGFSPLRPEGTLSVSSFRLAENSELNAAFIVGMEGNAYSLFSDSVLIGALRLDALDALVRVEEESVGFTASALRFEEVGGEEDFGEVRLGRIGLEGSYVFKNPFLQASLALDSFSAADMLVGLRPLLKDSQLPEAASEIAERLLLTTEVFVTTDFSGLSFNVPRLVAAYRGVDDAFAVMSLSGTKSSLSVRDANVFWTGESASASLSLDFSDPADIAFSAQTLYRGVPYSFEGLLLDGRNLSFGGEYGLSGNILFSEFGGISGTFSTESLPIPLDPYRIFVSSGLSFRFAAADAWSAEIHRLSLEETGGALQRPVRIALRGKADQSGASIDSLSIDDPVGRLSGEGKMDWRNGFTRTSAAFRLSDTLGEERYELEASMDDPGLSGRFYGAGMRFSRFHADPYKARATGEARFRWSGVSDYEANFKLADLRAEVDASEYRLSGSGRVDPRVLELENLRLATKAGIANVASFTLDRESSRAAASASYRGFFAGREADTSLSASAAFAPFSDWTRIPDALSDFSVNLGVGRTRFGAIDFDPFRLELIKEDSTFALNGGPQNALRLRFDDEGAFFVALSAPSPIRGNVIGSIKGGMIDARANGLYLDFPALWDLLNIPDVRFTGGIVTGSLEISGPLGDPDFFGSAAATGFRALVPAWVAEEIGPVSGLVAFDGKDFSFGPFPVGVRKGGGTLSGHFRFDRWVPFTFSLLVDIAKNTPIPVKADVAGISARGFASGKLEIYNNSETLGIAGGLELENTSMTLDAEALAAASGQVFKPMGVVVDLKLKTGRKVEFVWPSSDIPVLRGYADTGDTLAIDYDGMTGRYSLAGDIDFRGGEVFYFMRSFYIRGGAIKFNENQLQFDPRLSIVAELRDRNIEGPVTISLVIEEARLSSFMPRFESTPPLSQAEIFGMLGQNLIGQDASGASSPSGESVLAATSDVLAQFNVVRVFERNVRDFTGLDMFSVRTQLIQNAFLGAAGLMDTPVDRNAGLGNYFDNTTVYMGKFLGSDVFLQGMVSLQVDESKSDNLLGGLTIEPEFGVEWKTPFFMLRWNFAPDMENFGNLFINDHSFTITWRKAF